MNKLVKAAIAGALFVSTSAVLAQQGEAEEGFPDSTASETDTYGRAAGPRAASGAASGNAAAVAIGVATVAVAGVVAVAAEGTDTPPITTP